MVDVELPAKFGRAMLLEVEPSAVVRVDLHCHSSASYDGKVNPVRLVELARDRGLTHIAITDHETIDGALAAQAANVAGIAVIVGEEVRTTEGDLILLYVSESIPAGLSPEDTVQRAREQGCLIGLPHPFDFFRPSIGRGAVNTDQLRRLADLADYVEIHNGRIRDQTANARAADFARELQIPMVAVSDAHMARDVALSATVFEAFVETPGDLRVAIKAGGSLRVRADQTRKHRLPGAFTRSR